MQAEFSYKVKPKLPQQFKAAEVNGVPFAVILGEEEQAQGKVKIKEMGLRDGHPEKDGVLVDLSELGSEMRYRIKRKAELDGMTKQAEGLRVVDGIRGEPEKAQPEPQPEPQATPAAEDPLSVETIEAVPAS